jgi:predicted PurR-regulated permease PerM
MNQLDAVAPFGQYVRRVWAAAGIVAFVVLLALTLICGVQVFLVAFFGVLWGNFLHRVSYNVSRATRISYGWSLAAVSLLLTAAVLLAVFLFARHINHQMVGIVDHLREAVHALRQDPAVEKWIKRLPEIGKNLGQGDALASAKTTLGTISESLGEIAIVFVLGLYFAADPGLYYNGIVKLFPLPLRPRCAEVLNELGHTLWAWTLGRLAAMAIIGVTISIGLWLLGMPLALGLGVLAGAMTFIPSIGPTLAAAPAVLIAFQQGPWEVLYVLILYSVVQGGELKFVTPLIQQHVVRMPPSVQLIAQMLFWWFMGLLGLTLATPIAAVVMVLVKELYVKDTLGDRDIVLPSSAPVEAGA